jgi:hypothetical protein
MAFFDLLEWSRQRSLLAHALLVYANIVSVHGGFITQWSVSPRGFLAEREFTPQDRRPIPSAVLWPHLAQYTSPAHEATLAAREM